MSKNIWDVMDTDRMHELLDASKTCRPADPPETAEEREFLAEWLSRVITYLNRQEE